MASGDLSEHPVDQLVRELIDSGRAARDEETELLLRRIATAPFNPLPVRVPSRERGASYWGRTLGAREPSLIYHLIKRVVIEQQ